MNHLKGYHCALSFLALIAINANIAAAADLGCGFLECNSGCLVFRTDAGTAYQFAVPPILFKGAHRIQITGTINASCTPLCGGSSGCMESPVITACYSGSCMDTAADFKRGESINLKGTNGQLDIKSWNETKTSDPPVLPYLWVACSHRGTVMRIAAVDHYSPVDGRCVSAGDLLGQYLTAPLACGGDTANPSRTTVDFDGNVWVANRNDITSGTFKRGHAVKIGSGLAFQWVDRNGNGVLDTSQFDAVSGQPNILPWTNPDGVCTSGYLGDPNAGDVQYAQDELILAYRVFDGNNQPMGTRTMAVDRNNDVWVGGNANRWHEHVDGQTGQTTFPTPGVKSCGGYGGLVDCAGVLWSARSLSNTGQILRLPPTGASSCVPVTEAYGLAANTLGQIWNSMWTANTDRKLSAAGATVLTTTSTAPSALLYRGVVVTPEDNDVWTAATGSDSSQTAPFKVTRHSDTGVLRGGAAIDLAPHGGQQPTGVAVDSRGFVWVTNKFSNNVMRINPTGGINGWGGVDLVVSLGAGAVPYNYSDMTGVNLYTTIAPAGVWTGVFDSGVTDKPWYSVTWTGQIGDGAIIVKVRAANQDYDLGKHAYVGAPFQQYAVSGRFLQVRVQLDARCKKTPSWVWPTMQSLAINEEPGHCPPASINDALSVPPNCVVDARYPHLPNNPSAKRGIGNPTSANPQTDKIRIQLGTAGSPVCGADRAECWTLCETGGVNQNSITGRVHLGNGLYEIQVAQAITAGRATTIRYIHDYASDSMTYFSHPANVDGGSQSNPADLLTLIDYLNGVGTVLGPL